MYNNNGGARFYGHTKSLLQPTHTHTHTPMHGTTREEVFNVLMAISFSLLEKLWGYAQKSKSLRFLSLFQTTRTYFSIILQFIP